MDHNFANLRILMQVLQMMGFFITLGKYPHFRFLIKDFMTAFRKMETFPISTSVIDGIELLQIKSKLELF